MQGMSLQRFQEIADGRGDSPTALEQEEFDFYVKCLEENQQKIKKNIEARETKYKKIKSNIEASRKSRNKRRNLRKKLRR